MPVSSTTKLEREVGGEGLGILIDPTLERWSARSSVPQSVRAEGEDDAVLEESRVKSFWPYCPRDFGRHAGNGGSRPELRPLWTVGLEGSKPLFKPGGVG